MFYSESLSFDLYLADFFIYSARENYRKLSFADSPQHITNHAFCVKFRLNAPILKH